MRNSKRITNRSRKSSSQSSPDVSQVPRGTPQAAVITVGSENLSNFRDRLQRITLNANPYYLIRLAERSRTYRDLIRRYSNDSML